MAPVIGSRAWLSPSGGLLPSLILSKVEMHQAGAKGSREIFITSNSMRRLSVFTPCPFSLYTFFSVLTPFIYFFPDPFAYLFDYQWLHRGRHKCLESNTTICMTDTFDKLVGRNHLPRPLETAPFHCLKNCIKRHLSKWRPWWTPVLLETVRGCIFYKDGKDRARIRRRDESSKVSAGRVTETQVNYQSTRRYLIIPLGHIKAPWQMAERYCQRREKSRFNRFSASHEQNNYHMRVGRPPPRLWGVGLSKRVGSRRWRFDRRKHIAGIVTPRNGRWFRRAHTRCL